MLTERGFAALRNAWPIYAQGIAEHFARHLTGAELETFTTALTRVLQAETPAAGTSVADG